MKYLVGWSLALGATALMGCSDHAYTRSKSSDVFEQAPVNLVDILWVVDNSISMAQEQNSLAIGAQDFVNRLLVTDIDFHMGVITTDMNTANLDAAALIGNPPVLDATVPNYVQAFQDRVLVGTDGDDQEKGLQAAITALTPPMANTRNAGFLRDDALLFIVVLSDENDCSDYGALGPESDGEDCYSGYELLTPVSDLVRSITDIKGDASRVVLSGIVGPDAVENCIDSVPGKRYFTAIGMLGGFQGNICETNYSNMMDSLGEIASGIRDAFPLDHVPDPTTIEVTIAPVDSAEESIVEDATNGWTYNDDATAPQILFHGTAVPPRGAQITIEYTIAGEIENAG